MGLGWLGAVDLALKAFQGFAKGKAAKNQAQAQKAADQREYKAKGDLWRSNEAHRATGMDAASALLGRVQPSLGKGAPDYQIDPATLAHMKEARPFPGSLPADPTAGSTWALLGGVAGSGAEAIDQYQLGKLLRGGMHGSDAAAGQSVDREVGTVSPASPVRGDAIGVENFGGGADRARVCALAPSLPGCQGFSGLGNG